MFESKYIFEMRWNGMCTHGNGYDTFEAASHGGQEVWREAAAGLAAVSHRDLVAWQEAGGREYSSELLALSDLG